VRRTTARSANASTRYNLRPFDFEITCVRANGAFRSPLCARRLGTIRARRRLGSLALADRRASAAFVGIIGAFLLTILLAAIFAGLSHPVYQWVLVRVGGRKAFATIATLVLLLVLVMAPLLAVLGAGANEALRVA